MLATALSSFCSAQPVKCLWFCNLQTFYQVTGSKLISECYILCYIQLKKWLSAPSLYNLYSNPVTYLFTTDTQITHLSHTCKHLSVELPARSTAPTLSFSSAIFSLVRNTDHRQIPTAGCPPADGEIHHKTVQQAKFWMHSPSYSPCK